MLWMYERGLLYNANSSDNRPAILFLMQTSREKKSIGYGKAGCEHKIIINHRKMTSILY